MGWLARAIDQLLGWSRKWGGWKFCLGSICCMMWMDIWCTTIMVYIYIIFNIYIYTICIYCILPCDPISQFVVPNFDHVGPTWSKFGTTNSLGMLVDGVLLTDQGMVRLEVEKPTLCDSWLEVVQMLVDADLSQGELYEHIDYCLRDVWLIEFNGWSVTCQVHLDIARCRLRIPAQKHVKKQL